MQQIQLRPYQREAVSVLTKTKRMMVKAPAGSGKTVIGSAAVSAVIGDREQKPAIVVIANTNEQCQQWGVAFDLFDIRTRATVEIGCGVGNVDTRKCDLLIVDECHHATAPTWLAKVKSAGNAVWGFSATPLGTDDDRNNLLLDIFPKVHEVKRDELVDDGHLVPALVRYLPVNCPGIGERIDERAADLIKARKRRYPYIFANKKQAAEQESRCVWQAAMEIGILDNPERDDAIAKTAVSESGNSVIVLVATIEHGERLAGRIPAAALCHSKLPKKQRTRIIAQFKEGIIPVLVATTLADEGLDCPIAGVIILANGGRHKGRIEQRTGRVLRPYQNKSCGIIYDFHDRFHYFLAAQATARARTYQRLKYKIQK